MTSTTTLIIMISVMLVINVGLSMVQAGIYEVNPSGTRFFNLSDTPYSNYASNDALIVDESFLPSDEAVQVDPAGNYFTDTYASARSWSRQSPLKFIGNVLSQPFGFLKDVGVSVPIAVAFGVFWYMIAIIVVVSWWLGR